MILHVGGHNDGALTAFDPATGAVKWTWTGDGPGLWLADHRGYRRHAPGRRVLAAESRWRRTRPRRAAAVERAVRSALDDELDYAARLRRQHHHRVRAGQAADGVHRREQGRQSGWPISRGRTRRCRCRSATPCSWATPSSRCRRSTAVSSSGPMRRSGKTLWLSEPRQAGNAAITRSGDLLFVLKDYRRADGGKSDAWRRVHADQDVHRGDERDVGAARDLRQSHFREGHRHARAVDAELVGRRTIKGSGDVVGYNCGVDSFRPAASKV